MVSFNIQLKFPDHFGFSARVHVSSSISTIEDLETHISELFGIGNNFYLMIYDDVLHPNVSIKVLYPWAVVTVHKGSFFNPLDLPLNETYFDKLKRCCTKLKGEVLEFFGVFENNSSTEEVEDMSDLLVEPIMEMMPRQAGSRRYFWSRDLGLDGGAEKIFKINSSNEEAEEILENQNVTAELDLKTHVEKVNQNRRPTIELRALLNTDVCVDQVSPDRKSKRASNKDEDSDDSFMIVD